MVANYKQVFARYEGMPDEVRWYFTEFEPVFNCSWDVIVSYVFARVEFAKHMTIYCGIVKLHKTDAQLTRELIDRDHMTKGRFQSLFEIVFGRKMDEALAAKLKNAENIRNKVVHGKGYSEAEARTAVVDVLEFARDFNAYMFGICGFRPFADLRGFKGAAGSLSKETTKWVLRGMGIPAKELRDT